MTTHKEAAMTATAHGDYMSTTVQRLMADCTPPDLAAETEKRLRAAGMVWDEQRHDWVPGPASLAYDDSGDLVPGWHDSPEGRADAADQARWDRQETRTNG